MSDYRSTSSQEQNENDGTIFRPNPEILERRHLGSMPAYEEEQPFDQVWLWALMGLELLIILITFFVSGQPLWAGAVGFLAITLSMALLSAVRLRTRIDGDGVHYRFTPFHFKWQMIPWEDIDQIYVRKYSPILEYGGWGIRYGRKGRAYNIRGNMGLQIVRKNGKRILIGTRRPEEAANALSRHPLLV